jgi:hypothetical protein
MKFLITIYLFFCSSLGLLAQDKEFTIKGSIKKYPSRSMAFLFYKSSTGRLVDSAEIVKGSFTFRGKIDEPRPAGIALRKPGETISIQHYTSFYIEPGELTFTSRSDLSTASITGSPASFELQELDNLGVNVILRRPDSVSVTRTTKSVALPSGAGSPVGAVQGTSRPVIGGTSPMIRVITEVNELPLETQSIIRKWEEEAKDKVLQFIKDHPRSFVSLYTLYKLWVFKKISSEEYHNMLTVLDASLLQSNEGKVMFPM